MPSSFASSAASPLETSPWRVLNAPLLVVEDSDEDFDTLVEAFHASGQTRTIHRALSGDACIAFLRGESGDPSTLPYVTPALIFMDLNSHGLDGREALVVIKNDPCLKKIPLVILTTSSNPKDLTFCLNAGANAYHVKPVRYDHYLRLLGSVLHYWLESAAQDIPTAGVR